MGRYIDNSQYANRNSYTSIREIPTPSKPRLRKRLGIEYAYDHANPSMYEDILIRKVLTRYRFNDMQQIAIYYGVDQLKAAALDVFGNQQPRRVVQIIRNIEKGLDEALLEKQKQGSA